MLETKTVQVVSDHVLHFKKKKKETKKKKREKPVKLLKFF